MVVVVGTLAIVAGPRLDPSVLLRAVSREHPHLYWWGFAIGLLQAQWTFTGYDASAHVTEETVDPTRKAPWGIFLSVAVSGVAGWVMLLAVTSAIRPGGLAATMAEDNAFIYILKDALGERLGLALVWVVIGAMWFCGLASVTSNSRMLFAFARDGGLPFAGAIAKVSPRWKSPSRAVWLSVAAALVVAIFQEAYAAMTALSTLALYASYALPIVAGLRARRSGRWRIRGPWDLGRWSTAVNVIALAWIAVITVLFVQPPYRIAGWTFLGTIALLVLYWALWMRKRFTGPRVTLEEMQRSSPPASDRGGAAPASRASRGEPGRGE